MMASPTPLLSMMLLLAAAASYCCLGPAAATAADGKLMSGNSTDFHCPTCNNKCNCSCVAHTKSVSCVKQRLTSVPVDLPQDVVHLDLSNNLITSLTGLANLTNLTDLQLSHNQVSKWDESWLTGLPALRQLKLTQNKLTSPPSPLCSRLPALQRLYLDNNELSGNFPADYQQCRTLSRLTLSDNPYTTIDNATLCSLAATGKKPPAVPLSLNLNRLKLARVQPGALACLSQRLRALYLGQSSLPQDSLEALIGASRLRKLESLNLRLSSRLQAVTEHLLSGADALRTLMLDGSASLSQLEAAGLAQTPRLSQLSLRNTNVSTWFGATVDQLAKLQRLDLSGAPVTTIGGLNGSSANPLHQLASEDIKHFSLDLTGVPLACDCSLYWLSQQVLRKPVLSRLVNASSLVCAQPAAQHGRRLLDFAPANNHCDAPGPGFFTPKMIAIVAAVSAATIVGALVLVAIGVVCVRRRRRFGSDGDGGSDNVAPRLVFSGDDMRDPLVAAAAGDSGRRDSVWIRLRRLLRHRRSDGAAVSIGASRPPIFSPAQPEDYLSADDA